MEMLDDLMGELGLDMEKADREQEDSEDLEEMERFLLEVEEQEKEHEEKTKADTREEEEVFEAQPVVEQQVERVEFPEITQKEDISENLILPEITQKEDSSENLIFPEIQAKKSFAAPEIYYEPDKVDPYEGSRILAKIEQKLESSPLTSARRDPGSVQDVPGPMVSSDYHDKLKESTVALTKMLIDINKRALAGALEEEQVEKFKDFVEKFSNFAEKTPSFELFGKDDISYVNDQIARAVNLFYKRGYYPFIKEAKTVNEDHKNAEKIQKLTESRARIVKAVTNINALVVKAENVKKGLFNNLEPKKK